MKVTSLPLPPSNNPANKPTGPNANAPTAPQPTVPPTLLTFSSVATDTSSTSFFVNVFDFPNKPSPGAHAAVNENARSLADITPLPFVKSPACIRMISPQMAAAVNHHFSDGVCFAYHFVDQPTRLEIDDKLKYYSWHLSYTERMALDYKR